MRALNGVAAVMVAAAIAVTASGCVGEGPAPSPSPTASASPTPTAAGTPIATATPTPTPTPEAEDAYDPADMGTWEITYSGIGPVLLDRPVDDVLAEVPSGEEPCRPGIASFFDSGVVGVGDGSDLPVVAVATTGPTQNVDPSARPHTDAGITSGSTFSALLTAYPAAEPFTDSQGRPGYRLTDGSSWIHFTSVDGQTINIIDVSRSPTDLKEYCG
ncbi:hypothetical protein N1027_11660 [Herbiconiux sp. CPCC 205763]|uniref:Lipoprotein n=1 Tax=Herbiconiux aconitum TaxID=2970913 RepID=A0ABT2GRE0_9MICO|nr:hypothetical protein [Herbiconiux aconitum]MCS5718790.1 hypothetical protein [Herbiconiux aconitum]